MIRKVNLHDTVREFIYACYET